MLLVSASKGVGVLQAGELGEGGSWLRTQRDLAETYACEQRKDCRQRQ